jgi:hypothetical protein
VWGREDCAYVIHPKPIISAAQRRVAVFGSIIVATRLLILLSERYSSTHPAHRAFWSVVWEYISTVGERVTLFL